MKKIFLILSLVLVFCGCQSNKIENSDNKKQDSQKVEEIKENKKVDFKVIEKKEDCEKLFTKKDLHTYYYNFENLDIVLKEFGIDNQSKEQEKDIFIGWCLYKKVDNNYQVIGFDILPSINPLVFIKNKFLIYQRSCGSSCSQFSYLNVNSLNENGIIGGSVYYELSNDNKWIIEYDNSLWGRNKTNNYLVRAINLDNFKTFEFAENNCLKNNCNFVFDYRNLQGIKEINFIDNKTNIISIPFFDEDTEEKIIRKFDINKNFGEIK